MSLVYLVTSGEYSDYGVDAVFSTREAAVAFAAEKAENRWNVRWVEVYPLDNPDGAGIRRPWSVELYYATGDLRDAVPESNWALDPIDREPWVGKRAYDVATMFRVTVLADTEEQAVKAANERRVQHKAMQIDTETLATP